MGEIILVSPNAQARRPASQLKPYLRRARKCRGVTVPKAVALLFLARRLLSAILLRYSLVLHNMHAGTHVI